VRRVFALVLAVLLGPAAGLFAVGIVGAGPAAASSPGVFPVVSGKYGQTPKITFPVKTAPSALESKVLYQGKGPLTKKGDLLVANYVGQIWNGKVFDSSFSRKQLSGFGIGVGDVIPGWDDTLVGVHIGSRMLLVIPPKDGYGSGGQSAAGITGKDVIVFVVDVVGSYSSSTEAQANAVSTGNSVPGITVTGKVGGPATVSVAKGTKKPSALKVVVLDKGTGPKVTAGLVVVQYAVTNWSGSEQSTWKTAPAMPQAENIDQSAGTGFPNALAGVPIGSRVLIELPAADVSSGGPYALVCDVVAEPADPQS